MKEQFAASVTLGLTISNKIRILLPPNASELAKLTLVRDQLIMVLDAAISDFIQASNAKQRSKNASPISTKRRRLTRADMAWELLSPTCTTV